MKSIALKSLLVIVAFGLVNVSGATVLRYYCPPSTLKNNCINVTADNQLRYGREIEAHAISERNFILAPFTSMKSYPVSPPEINYNYSDVSFLYHEKITIPTLFHNFFWGNEVAIPKPDSFTLMALGLIVLVLARKRLSIATSRSPIASDSFKPRHNSGGGGGWRSREVDAFA